jgi:amphiphysin
VGATADWHGHEPAISSKIQLERSSTLKEAYAELKEELLQEINLMDTRVINPAVEAKDSIQPIKKTIKKRENKRLDYERYQDRVNNASKKQRRSDGENASLAKSEPELAKAADVSI